MQVAAEGEGTGSMHYFALQAVPAVVHEQEETDPSVVALHWAKVAKAKLAQVLTAKQLIPLN